MSLKEPLVPLDPNEEISALIEMLHQTGQRLEKLTAGEVDTVADRDGRTFLLRGTQKQLRHSEDARKAVLLKNQRALEAQNERLEEAVSARTRELAEANGRLTILDHSKNEFLELISHEFRTPLNGLFGVGELIFDGMPISEENSELQDLFERSRARILSILDDALLLTQIDVTGDKFHTAPLSLAEVLELAVASATAFANSRQVTFSRAFVGGGLVVGHKDLLARALRALLEAAVKFSEDGYIVSLSTDVVDDSPTVKIESHGRTIPSPAIENFFRIFSIGEATTPGGDLGLGPALAFRILSLFNASVTVANRDPSGIRLTISLLNAASKSGSPALETGNRALSPGQSPVRVSANEDEVSALIGTLLKTGQRLEELTGGEVDTVADRDGRTFLLRGTLEQLRHSDEARKAVVLNNQRALEVQNERLEDAVAVRTRELAEANDQLTIKMASLGTLTVGIAHEIKNPLNFINNFADVSTNLLDDLRQALQGSAEPAPVEEIISELAANLRRIRNHGERADSILRAMLTHASGAGQREPTDVNALVAGAVEFAYQGLRTQDSKFNITIESSYDPKLPIIQTVPNDLRRAFLNIANNGCYAAHQKSLRLGERFQPMLKVSTQNGGSQIEIRIEDNGSGISQDALQKIFDPFFTTKPPGSGIGLGLSLSYQIVVEQHNGTMRVETKEGESTALIILLPNSGRVF